MAQVTIAFDSWKEGHVAPSRHEIPVIAHKSIIKLEAVSSRLKGELIHPNRTSVLRNNRFSPDGKRLIAGDYPGGVIVVWDVATGKELTRIETGYGYRPSSELFFLTPDWQTLFVSRGKRKVEMVEQGGKRLRRWEVEGDVRAFDLATGQLRRTYKHEPPRSISFLEHSRDGTRFVTFEELPGSSELSPPRAVSLWDVQTGQYRSLPTAWHAVSFSPDERILAFAAVDESGCTHALKLVDLVTGRERLSIPIHEKYRAGPTGWGAVRFSPDGRTLGFDVTDEDGFTHALKLFDQATGREKLSIPIKDKNVWCGFPTFSPDGRLMVGNYRVFEHAKNWKNSRTWIKWWDSATGAEVGSFTTEDKNDRLFFHFCPDGHTLAVIADRGEKAKLFLFHGPGGQPAKTLLLGEKGKGEELTVRMPVFSPDGRWMAVITQTFPDTRDDDLDVQDVPQPRIHLIDVAAEAIRETMIAPQGFAISACFSPDGKMLATGGHGRILLWDLAKLPSTIEDARKP
jgi:WD40 repeat protein